MDTREDGEEQHVTRGGKEKGRKGQKKGEGGRNYVREKIIEKSIIIK